MAVDAAPTKFPSTLPDELTPGDTIVDETSAWMARHTDQGMECRLGCFLMDPRRNGKAYVTGEIKPNNTGAGVNNIYRYGIRFFRYDLTTRSVDHVSYVKEIVQASSSADQWRGGALATATGSTLWCMYFEGSSDLDNGARLSTDLYVSRSLNGGQTWTGETLVKSSGFGGTDYQRPQIAINSDGFGLMLYVEEDLLAQTADYYVRTLDESTNTWGNETNILSLGSGVDAAAKTAHSLAVAEDGTAMAVLWNGLDGSDNQYAHFYFDGSSWSNLGNSTAGGSSGGLRRLNSVLVNNGTQATHQKHFISFFCNSTGNTSCQLIDPSSGPQMATSLNSTIFALDGSNGDSLAGVLDPEDDLFIVGQSGTSANNIHRTRYGKWSYSTVSSIGQIGNVVAGSTDQLNWYNGGAGDDGWFEDIANTAGTSSDTYPQITYHNVLPFVYDQDLHLILCGKRFDGVELPE